MDPSIYTSAMLIPSALAVPLYISPEEAAMGRMVFQNFVHEEFEQEGVSDEDILGGDELQVVDDEEEFIDENFAAAYREISANAQAIQISHIGTSIRELADEFARSQQRRSIRRHADEVDLGAITFKNFYGLLDEVFKDGMTGSNLIALFFFCSDVLIRCARTGLRHIGLSLFRWALQYIFEQVCKWVHEHGGWENICGIPMKSKVIRYVAVGFLAVGVSWLIYRGIRN